MPVVSISGCHNERTDKRHHAKTHADPDQDLGAGPHAAAGRLHIDGTNLGERNPPRGHWDAGLRIEQESVGLVSDQGAFDMGAVQQIELQPRAGLQRRDQLPPIARRRLASRRPGVGPGTGKWLPGTETAMPS